MDVESYYCGSKRLSEKQHSFLCELALLFAKYSMAMLEEGKIAEVDTDGVTSAAFLNNLSVWYHGDLGKDFVLNASLGSEEDLEHQIDVVAIVE